MDPKLLEILVCPLCKGPLLHRPAAEELVCKADRLGFPIKDGIPADDFDAIVRPEKMIGPG